MSGLANSKHPRVYTDESEAPQVQRDVGLGRPNRCTPVAKARIHITDEIIYR
jgi:hypothetical protein